MRILCVLLFGLSFAASSGFANEYNIPTASGTMLDVPGLEPVKVKTSCGGHPAQHSYQEMPEAMVFTIHHGEKGRCVIDAGQGYTRNRPWAERTEVQSQKFKQGERYFFKVEVSMDPDFDSAHETTVFQVHQWDDKKCRCGPYVMVMFDRRGILMVKVLKADHSHQLFYTDVSRDQFEGRWVEIAADIDTGKENPHATIYVDAMKVVDTDLFVQKGGTVFSKTGIYRPGNKYAESPTDRVYARNLLYRRLPAIVPLAEIKDQS